MNIKDQFENFELPVSENMWNEIEKQLPPEKKKRGFIFWISAIALVGSAIAWFGYKSIYNDNFQFSSKTENQLYRNETKSKSIISNESSKEVNTPGIQEIKTIIDKPTQMQKMNSTAAKKHNVGNADNEASNATIKRGTLHSIKKLQRHQLYAEAKLKDKNTAAALADDNTNMSMARLKSIAGLNVIPYEMNIVHRHQHQPESVDSSANEHSAKDKLPKQLGERAFRVGFNVVRLHNESEILAEQYEYEGKEFLSRVTASPGENSMGYYITGSYASKRYFRAEIGIGLRYFNRADFVPSIWKDANGNYFATTSIGNLIFDKSIIHISGLAIPAASLEQVILPKYNDAGDTTRLLTNEQTKYIDIPLLAGWQMTKNRKLTPYALAGVHYLLPISKKASMINTFTKKEVVAKYTSGLNYKAVWAPTLKLGAEYDVLPRLSINARAAYTLLVTPAVSMESSVQMARKTYRFDHFEYWIGVSYRLK
ncbi:MAG: hypothetical protein IPO27_02895 [Bacteroidetes bacterium]|nr:hypothetical protein [Bacteroidota bacterium]